MCILDTIRARQERKDGKGSRTEGCLLVIVVSLEGELVVVLQLSNALPDIVEGPVGVLLLEEESRVQRVDHCFDAAHVQNAVEQELV